MEQNQNNRERETEEVIRQRAKKAAEIVKDAICGAQMINYEAFRGVSGQLVAEVYRDLRTNKL